jgi:hypothetical protein
MESRLHGIVSLALIAAAMAIGWWTTLGSNLLAGLFYGALLLIGSFLIVYVFCTKCPIRASGCRHVLPGRLTPWLPARLQTPYTVSDYLAVGVILLVLIAYPQIWLVPHKITLLLFWLLLAAGLLEIILFVCQGCGNVRCLVCKVRNKPTEPIDA